MSELHEANVSRLDLRSRSASPASASLDDGIKDQWRRKLDLAYKDAISEQLTYDTYGPVEASPGTLEDLNEEAYEFQLFSQIPTQSAVSTPQPPKIFLRSPSLEVKEPGFIRSVRSHDFYFTGAVTSEDQKRMQDVAIEGQHVMRESKTTWPGFKLPWRVTTVTLPSHEQANAVTIPLDDAQSRKRKRPGKKRRIAIRTKTQARKEREKVARLAEAEKAALMMEKRSKRNREKKLKRREKARSQKKDGITAPETLFQVKLTMKIKHCALIITNLLLDSGWAASPPCYSPTGDTLPNYGVCDPRIKVSLCCASGETCLSNGLCSTPAGILYRGGCSDRSYKSGFCPLFCTPVSLNAFLSTCDSDSPGNGFSFCCDAGRKPGECCNNGSEILSGDKPYSSITAGPPRATGASILRDDDPSLPTSTTFRSFTTTVRRTVSSSRSSSNPSPPSPSSFNPSSSNPNPQQSTIPPVTEAASHSNLGAGLGGGLGGSAALVTGIAVFICCRRRYKRVKEGVDTHQEMDADNSTHRPNSMLFPAELAHEESLAWKEPAELSPQAAELPPGPYELPGDATTIVDDRGPPTISDNAEIRLQHKPELRDPSDTDVEVKRPLAQKRMGSGSGPWQDDY
ncbi:MAG: hypothetical protein Q9172_003565 [Xanthocarpia lactea]